MFDVFFLINTLYYMCQYVHSVLLLNRIMLYMDERHVEFDKKNFFEVLTCYCASNISCNFLLFTRMTKIVFINCYSSSLPLYNIVFPHPERSTNLVVQCHTHLHTDLLTVHIHQIQKLLGKNSLFLDKHSSKNHG